MGGSQGASGVNDLVLQALPQLLRQHPGLQFIHLAGPADVDKVRAVYDAGGVRAVVRPFLSEMELAMGAATAAVSRAGASSMAELAALRLPAVLVPYPFAADNHQLSNARAFAGTGAALMLEQKGASGEMLAGMLGPLLSNAATRGAMAKALERWDAPHAAEMIADRVLAALQGTSPGRWSIAPGPAEFSKRPTDVDGEPAGGPGAGAGRESLMGRHVEPYLQSSRQRA
jgi:UDP-N-acetylglucosamine--N-acetylmuramyl-(pentapeptide) pyrophosphoryl-undecaprenol N-acetylglucosamine transferase